ncbi:MAG: NAD(P)H-dependent glycerol-3-phosphate dehydrogenase [Bacteroidia bacterium]
MRVALIGAGSWGCALAAVLFEKGHTLRWWVHNAEIAEQLGRTGRHPTIFPDKSFPLAQLEWIGLELELALQGAEAAVLALPSRYVEPVLAEAPKLEGFWVSCTKGLLPNPPRRPTTYLQARGVWDFAVLSGPSHAEEVIERRPTWVAVAASDPERYSTLEALFASSYFALLPTSALEALEWVGVLKNIYAVGMGVVSLWGDNARAALAAAVLRELQEVLTEWVSQEAIPFLSPGWAGDFLVTAFSAHSRNQRLGQLLAQGYSPSAALQKLGMVAEGYYAAQSLGEVVKLDRFPFLRAIVAVLRGDSPPASLGAAVRETLARS